MTKPTQQRKKLPTPYQKMRGEILAALDKAYREKTSPLFYKGQRIRSNGYADAFWLGFDGGERHRIPRATPASACYEAGRKARSNPETK